LLCYLALTLTRNEVEVKSSRCATLNLTIAVPCPLTVFML
jgi:hypothetical protein